ncbi:MAG: DUF58 domain-containing protein [Planctomycetota bacterium]
MRFTVFGVKALLFYAAILGAYYAAPYVNLFFLLLAFLTIQWGFSALWTWRNLRGVAATVGDAPTIPAGAHATIDAVLEGPGRPRVDVRLTVGLTGGARAVGEVPVLRGRVERAIEVPPLPRGIHRVESTCVTSTYPLGLLRRRVRVDGPEEIVVFPTPASTAESASRSAEDLVRDLLGASVHGAGDLQPSGLREHRDGDSLRSIHWRASARRGKLVVREWEGGAAQGLEVVLDRRSSPEALEEGLSELAAIVLLAREAKEVLAIRSQGLADTFGEGHAAWDGALRFLAGADVLPPEAPGPPSTSPSVLRLPREVARV